MPFTISKEAEIDLESIARYTEEVWGKAQAAKYLRALNKKFEFLAESPLINRERVELTPPARIHHHEHHLILYLSIENSVLIVRVLHENMDIETQYSS